MPLVWFYSTHLLNRHPSVTWAVRVRSVAVVYCQRLPIYWVWDMDYLMLIRTNTILIVAPITTDIYETVTRIVRGLTVIKETVTTTTIITIMKFVVSPIVTAMPRAIVKTVESESRAYCCYVFCNVVLLLYF